MKRRLVLPIILLLTLIVSSVSPYVIQVIQNNLNNDNTQLIVYDYEKQKVELKKGDFILFGKYLDEPILWEVLSIENNKALIMTHNIITFKPFDVSGKDEKYHNVDSEKYGSSDWNNSTLKEWLNSDEKVVTYSHCPPIKESTFENYNYFDNESGFLYSDNFTETEKDLITNDGVFILSQNQMSKYFSVVSRKKTCTQSCIIQNNAPYIVLENKSQWYWTSSSISTNNVSVAAVTSGGTFYKSLAYDSTMGVSPALYIDCSNLSACGSGTNDEPYMAF